MEKFYKDELDTCFEIQNVDETHIIINIKPIARKFLPFAPFDDDDREEDRFICVITEGNQKSYYKLTKLYDRYGDGYSKKQTQLSSYVQSDKRIIDAVNQFIYYNQEEIDWYRK